MGIKINGINNARGLALRQSLPPNWITAAGSLGNVNTTQPIYFQLEATDPLNMPLFYYFKKGQLPLGSSINPSTGLISGPSVLVLAETVYNFTITLTNNYSNVHRAFSITITI